MAQVTVRTVHNSDGYAAILRSAGTYALLGYVADGIVARTGGLAYRHAFHGHDRPAVAVFAHKSNYAKIQALANRRLEGAM